jgi:hypothetical protein
VYEINSLSTLITPVVVNPAVLSTSIVVPTPPVPKASARRAPSKLVVTPVPPAHAPVPNPYPYV